MVDCAKMPSQECDVLASLTPDTRKLDEAGDGDHDEDEDEDEHEHENGDGHEDEDKYEDEN